MIVFNNYRLTDIGGTRVTSINRPVAPSFNNRIRTSGASDGAYDFGKTMGTKVITAKLLMTGITLEDAQDKLRILASKIITDKACQLRFDDAPNKYYMARVTNIATPSQEYLNVEIEIEFTCVYPYLLGETTTVNTTVSNCTININGVIPSMPVITLTFKATASSIQVNNGSKYVKITDNFVVNDVVVINCSTGAVTKNGYRILNKLDWQNSIFFTLALGTNNLSISPVNVVDASISYNELWY